MHLQARAEALCLTDNAEPASALPPRLRAYLHALTISCAAVHDDEGSGGDEVIGGLGFGDWTAVLKMATASSTLPPPLLLQLPYELHCEIASYLPLSALVLYQTQLCRTLRSCIFAGRLTVRRPYAFQLVEWRRAAKELGLLLANGRQDNVTTPSLPSVKTSASIWDTSPTATPRPAPTHSVQRAPNHALLLRRNGLLASPVQSDGTMLTHKDHSDVALYERYVRTFGSTANRQPTQSTLLPALHLATRTSSSPPRLRVLSLLSRTGFPMPALTHLLHEMPELQDVETVLMTATGYTETLLWMLFVPRLHRRLATDAVVGADQPTCVETQAIVVPGPHAERGRGLRSGFKCFCFEKIDEGDDDAIFHVIFHDWYDETEAEATEDMLEHSQITCNTCKRSIAF